jgi:glycerol-3-phosphate acyltransferase PlsX
MKIAVDAMGGDFGPAPNVEGALQAVGELDVEVVLVGDEPQIRDQLRRLGGAERRITIIHAPQTVGMHESPSQVARKKRDSSIWVATELVKSGEASAVVSAGNTGASMVSAFFILGVIKGVIRPAIAVNLPTLTGTAIMLDAGANVDCTAQDLHQFGLGRKTARATR